MEHIVEELLRVVENFSIKFNDLPASEFSAKPEPTKWSKKKILGHLIDSAQNNLRRFICGQYEQVPPHVIYDQDFWVTANRYQQIKQKDIVTLWVLVNHRIAAILNSMPKEKYLRECNTGKNGTQLHTLGWLADDYVKHMKHHINQIIPGSFNSSYP